ncbi:hypothetical protein [Cellulomonas hominis]
MVARSALLGAAAGARASLGLAGPALTSARTPRWLRRGMLLGVAGELAGDKNPSTPSRLLPPGPHSRMISGAVGGLALARRAGARPVRPVLAGVLGAVVGTWGGAAWRAHAVGRLPGWQSGVAEDVVALGLTALACLPGRVAPPHLP